MICETMHTLDPRPIHVFGWGVGSPTGGTVCGSTRHGSRPPAERCPIGTVTVETGTKGCAGQRGHRGHGVAFEAIHDAEEAK